MPAKPRPTLVDKAVADLPRLHRDQVILVGVSGGRDSVALLHAVYHAGYQRLIVCHLDHMLRPDSDTDAWFTAELAQQYELPFEADRVNVAALAEERKLSIEAAARVARLEFFTQVARMHWVPRVLLGHHADDQVETLLLNLFRGSGRGGLSGMQPFSVHEVRGARMELHRPLLGIWRDEVDAYVAKHQLKYCEDASNEDPRFTRNRVRHELLPLLEKTLDRDIKRALWRTGIVLGAEEEYLAGQTPRVSPEPLRVADLKTLPLALLRRVVLDWLRANGVEDIGFDDVEAVCGLVTKLKPAKVNLAGNRHARRTAGKLRVE